MKTRQKQQSSPPTKRKKNTAMEHEIVRLKNSYENLDSLVKELMDKVDALEEKVSILQGNHLIANNHTSIPHSQFMVIGTNGEQIHWWEQGYTAHARASSKTQLPCSVDGCPQVYGTTYICKDCSTAEKLVAVCRPLKSGSKAYEDRLGSIRKRNINSSVNSCWDYHSNCVGRNYAAEEQEDDQEINEQGSTGDDE